MQDFFSINCAYILAPGCALSHSAGWFTKQLIYRYVQLIAPRFHHTNHGNSLTIASSNRSAHQSFRRFYPASPFAQFLFRTSPKPSNHVDKMTNPLALYYSVLSSLRSPLAHISSLPYVRTHLRMSPKHPMASPYAPLLPSIYSSDPCHPLRRVLFLFLV